MSSLLSATMYVYANSIRVPCLNLNACSAVPVELIIRSHVPCSKEHTPLSALRAGRAVEREAVSAILWPRRENGEKGVADQTGS
jgi:hypothetical protein